jgi:P27 family predicted phage terminase small subunit
MLYRLGVITILDRAVLAGYCQAYGRWVEAERKLKETPALLKMPSGYVQQNPWLTISNKQLELCISTCASLDSPRSRERVSKPACPALAASSMACSAGQSRGCRRMIISEDAKTHGEGDDPRSFAAIFRERAL